MTTAAGAQDEGGPKTKAQEPQKSLICGGHWLLLGWDDQGCSFVLFFFFFLTFVFHISITVESSSEGRGHK